MWAQAGLELEQLGLEAMPVPQAAVLPSYACAVFPLSLFPLFFIPLERGLVKSSRRPGAHGCQGHTGGPGL